jgi:hypothetical protein
MRKNKLKDLYIEDLGQVIGGKKVTTLAIGEEDPGPTTLAIGEEGPYPTTLALGEEEPLPQV